MDGENTTEEGAAESSAETTVPATVSADDFKAFASKMENRLGDMGRQLARANERAKAAKPATPPEETQGAAPVAAAGMMSQADFTAGLTFERVAAGLPEEAQADLRAKIDEGMSYKDAAAMATFFQAGLKSAEADRNGQQPPTKVQGKSGTPAPNASAGPEPSTWGEFLKLRRDNPKKAQAIWDHPDFDHTKLRSSS